MKGFLVLAAVLALAIDLQRAPKRRWIMGAQVKRGSSRPRKARSPKPQPDGRIIGGQAIDITGVPYQLSFLAFGSHICGAVLISPAWVVTAGHCADAVSVLSVSFRGGSNYHASGGQVVAASTVVIHPQYDSLEIDYDIAVYSTSGSFVIGVSVNVVSLPYPGQDWEHGEQSRTTGWGTLYEEGSLSPNLQAVSVPIVGLNQCRAAYGVDAVTERMLCAGVPQGGLDACQGDSGGPLTVNYDLAGLVSWGYGCARPSFPGVYTHVGYFRSFIAQQTGV